MLPPSPRTTHAAAVTQASRDVGAYREDVVEAPRLAGHNPSTGSSVPPKDRNRLDGSQRPCQEERGRQSAWRRNQRYQTYPPSPPLYAVLVLTGIALIAAQSCPCGMVCTPPSESAPQPVLWPQVSV